MKKLFIGVMLLQIFLGVSLPLFAGEVFYSTPEGEDQQVITYDDELSFRDFSGWNFDPREGFDFSGKTIYASSFSQESPETIVFSDETKNVTFVKCNLMNVVLPLNSTVIGSNQTTYAMQNDLRTWVVEKDCALGPFLCKYAPVKLMNEEYWELKGYSVDPDDIPNQKIEREEDAPKADLINP